MRFRSASLRMSAGVLVWAAHFAAIYGFAALACARGFAQAVPLAVGAASAVAAVLAIAIVVAGWRRRADFEHWLSAAIAGFALLAIAYETIAVALVPPCA